MPYEISPYPSDNNRAESVSKLFLSLCVFLRLKELNKAALRLQINGQAEHYNRDIVAGMRHYVSEHPSNFDTYVWPLMYAYNTEMDRATGLSLSNIVLPREPPSRTAFD